MYLQIPQHEQDVKQSIFDVVVNWFEYKVFFLLDRLQYRTLSTEQFNNNWRRRDWCIPFPMVLVKWEMQTASSRFWTRVTVFISNDDDLYTRHKYTTINTEYLCTRDCSMEFPLAQVFSSGLAGITEACWLRLDDILVSGKNNVEDLMNLEELLKWLSNAGLRLKKNKCVFMIAETVYCRHKVTKKGVTSVKANVWWIKKCTIDR